MMINEFERLIPICNLEAEIATGVREKETTSASIFHATLWKALKEQLQRRSKHQEKQRLIALFMIRAMVYQLMS